MQAETSKSDEQWIPISVLNTFNRMKARAARTVDLGCHHTPWGVWPGQVLPLDWQRLFTVCAHGQVLVPSNEPQPIATALVGSETVEVSEDGTKARAVLWPSSGAVACA